LIVKLATLVFVYALEIDLIPFNPTFGMKIKNTKKQVEEDDTDKEYSQRDTCNHI
jgi:hypothetical protein